MAIARMNNGSASIHSIAHRARAGADVPQKLAAARRERRQRHSAHFALGDLAVMLEQTIGEAARAGNDARVGGGFDLYGKRVQRIDRAEIEAGCGRAANALTRPAERFQ